MVDDVSLLRSTATIRERCGNITCAVSEGRSPHFALERRRLADVAQRVEAVTRANYPDLRIPYHSRWRHFEAGGVDRKGELDALLAGRPVAEQARARVDLTLVSVLLDAGAGADWRYQEGPLPRAGGGLGWGSNAGTSPAPHPHPGLPPPRGKGSYTRSEGLGVASFRAFMQGRFSSDPGDPLRVDAAALQRVDAALLADIFQAGDANPLVGLEGRATLLRRLGDTLAAQPETFGAEGRPGALFDALTQQGTITELPATAVLSALLATLGAIWLTGQTLGNTPLGDCWPHPQAGGEGATANRVPFHKLSQWLTYSLLEPLDWAGVTLTDVDGLTGLPEYRNGGLLLDGGVIVARDPAFASMHRWQAGDEFIVEWRALTVTLLDELAPLVRARLGVSAEQMPLARVLEGGTWAAGRQIAQELRDGAPPLVIESDGTVF